MAGLLASNSEYSLVLEPQALSFMGRALYRTDPTQFFLMKNIDRVSSKTGLVDPMPSAEDFVLAEWLTHAERSAFREMLAITGQPGLISFAVGLPATELLPREALADAWIETLKTDHMSLQLGPPFLPLKEQVVELMAQRGVECRPSQVFLTSGAQQGLNLLARLLLKEGAEVIVEEATYPGLLMVIEPYRPKVISVSTEKDGINVDEVEQRLANGARPAFIFTMSDGHNPLGLSLSQSKRERLVEIARRHRVPIIEDDVYSFLYYEGPSLPPMRALEDQWVLYVSSFSKTLGPGLRTGWMIVPEALIPRLSIIKDLTDIDSCTLTQRAIAHYLRQNKSLDLLASVRREYIERRDCMLQALEKHFSGIATWEKPTSGIFIWLRLVGGIDTAELIKTAVQREHVAFIPGKAFTTGDRDWAKACIRLSFTSCRREQIGEGIARLARSLQND